MATTSVAKYMVRERKPPSPTWRAFLDNHIKDLMAIDFFVVPTATLGVLFGFLVLAHGNRSRPGSPMRSIPWARGIDNA